MAGSIGQVWQLCWSPALTLEPVGFTGDRFSPKAPWTVTHCWQDALGLYPAGTKSPGKQGADNERNGCETTQHGRQCRGRHRNRCPSPDVCPPYEVAFGAG